ncbi:zinc finger protein 521 [Leptopilina boulardi]|uniref:zinc finger protein 521 n=1 Tax=Leptopilina boulardi TaxID=63433 RepID=UPI0021F5243F|nr:zinc finger protein 521 [Leptopilina boulardi]XP_051171831.1 zinc finger protein 521 [Leptopilina boulardi]
MTSTVVQEVRLSDPGELDSDGSSSEDRDARKRLLGEADSAGPKKRRKQSTPVRFPTSLMLGDHPESEEDEEQDAVSEGKPNSPAAESLQGHQRIKDENLNTEFRCQYCSQSFDGKATLDLHLECEHNLVASQLNSESQSPQSGSQIQMKVETINQLDQTLNLVNVPNIEMKNLASPWLTDQVQSQNQQSNEEWSASIHMMPKLPALPNFPGGLPQYLPLPPGFPLSDSSQIHRPNLGPAPMRIFNPDAYCDLCNKEFCNKYFLKTHKANKHGIYDSLNPVPMAENSGALSGPIYPIGQITGQLPGNSVKMEPILTVDNNVQSPKINQPSIPCDDMQKVHTDQGDQTNIIQTSDNERDLQYQSPGAMEMLFKQEYGLEQENSSFMPPPRHLSPQAIQQAKESNFNVERLRKLGVLNPDAFCEICCKEYCNNYFLRTHKLKRHGIIIQDEKPPINPGSAATWHQVQTSPLNLIINESGNGSEYSDRSTDDHECNSCGIRFQTQGLFESHRQRVHPDEEISSKNDFEHDTLDQRSISNNDSISEDLQKLQTMILQLNGIENKITPCSICSKECDSKAALKIHMQEHGITSEDASSPTHSREKSLTPLSTTTYCTLCEKEYPNQDALRKHISDDHKSISNSDLNSLPPIPSISMPTTPTSSVPTPERKSSSLTPTSSYCEICNKELCNKYFMKTHMQRMHGIEIENGAQIGGVICNICNKELCSKYFLRVHKHNTHGIIEEGSNLSTNSKPETFDASSSDDSALKPEQLGDLNHRYFTHFTEVCPICNRRFRSIKWLKAHLLGDHGKLGVDKWKELEQQYQANHTKNNRLPGTSRVPSINSNLKIPNGFESTQNKGTDLTSLGNQVLSNLFGSSTEDQQSKTYRCSYCNFSTTVLPFLFLHERSHTNPQENITENERILQCPLCPHSFSQPDHFHHHLLTRHQFPNFLSQFPPPLFNNMRLETFGEKILESKEQFNEKIIESSKDDDDQKQNSRINFNESESQKKNDTAVQVTPQGVYKCAQCGFATANLNRIKKHIKKDHKGFGEPTESVISELSKILKEVANKHKVPASYAMPQDMNSNPEKTIMQPFLIEEQQFLSSQDCSTTGSEESGSAKRFAPALVYLPVKARVSGSLTASFTLSPA